MSFQDITMAYHNILTRSIQTPCILVTPCLYNHSIISLIEHTVLYQEVTAHFQVNSIIIMTMSLYIQITYDTTITHIKMYRPKRTLANLEFIQQHIFTPVEMNQMRTKMVFSFCHLTLFYRYIGRSHRI